jgi:Gluconate 2-dehydrogenase subunit 3
MDRRTSIKWVMAVSAAWPHFGRTHAPDLPIPVGQGYGTDPNLMKVYHPGDCWPLTLSGPQQQTTAALADVILPADAQSPAASTIGVVAFIDEWVSAPYPRTQGHRPVILSGLAWIDAEAGRRFGGGFAALSAGQQASLCEDICDTARAGATFLEPARFFALFRDLTAAAFYCSPVGRRDLGYIGNVARLTFDAPPADLLRKLNLP